MNDNQYGLSSGVYTKDINRGLRVSSAIRAGITFVNTYRLISPSAPFWRNERQWLWKRSWN